MVQGDKFSHTEDTCLAQNAMHEDDLKCIVNTLTLKKFTIFIFFAIARSSVGLILIIFSNIAAEKICNQMTYFYNIQFVYLTVCVTNKRYSVCFQCCCFILPSFQFLAAFSKVCSVPPCSPQRLFGNSSISYFCSTLTMYKFFIKI